MALSSLPVDSLALASALEVMGYWPMIPDYVTRSLFGLYRCPGDLQVPSCDYLPPPDRHEKIRQRIATTGPDLQKLTLGIWFSDYAGMSMPNRSTGLVGLVVGDTSQLGNSLLVLSLAHLNIFGTLLGLPGFVYFVLFVVGGMQRNSYLFHVFRFCTLGLRFKRR